MSTQIVLWINKKKNQYYIDKTKCALHGIVCLKASFMMSFCDILQF